MFFHRKELIQPVNVGTPDARFGAYLLEQFGGATGELTAALAILGSVVPRGERRHPRHASGHRDRGVQPPGNGRETDCPAYQPAGRRLRT
jgi:hypothetical protein